MIAHTEDDEILRLAEEDDRNQERARHLKAVPTAAAATHIADIAETDTNDRRRYDFGIACVDKKALPAKPGYLTVIGATTGRGKTVFAEQASRHLAKRHTTFYAALEPTATEIRDSMTARDMGLTLEEHEREMRDNTEAFRAARRRLADLDLHIWRPGYGKPRKPKDIIEAALKLKSEIVFIDHARRIETWKPGEMANSISAWFAEAAEHYKLHIFMLAQLKVRQGRDYGTKPNEGDFADSSQLAQEAARVVLLHRPFAGHKTKDNVTEVVCPKNRFGPIFTSHLTWFGPTRSFYSMDEAEEALCECCKPKPKKGKETVTIAPARDPREIAEEDSLLEEARTLFPC